MNIAAAITDADMLNDWIAAGCPKSLDMPARQTLAAQRAELEERARKFRIAQRRALRESQNNREIFGTNREISTLNDRNGLDTQAATI
jgi:hypothetical protein